MQVLVRDHYTMVAAAVQCDVDGIPKWSHYGRVSPMGLIGNGSPLERQEPFMERVTMTI
jgi:hypothetical protein